MGSKPPPRRTLAEIADLFFSGRQQPGNQKDGTAPPRSPAELGRLERHLYRNRSDSPSPASECLQGQGGLLEVPGLAAHPYRQEGLLVVDGQGIIQQANDRARGLLGAEEHLEGRIFEYFIQPYQPRLISIRRPDRSAGIGEMVAVPAQWAGQAAYLVTIRQIAGRNILSPSPLP